MSLWGGGFVRLEPEPPPSEVPPAAGGSLAPATGAAKAAPAPPVMGSFGSLLAAARESDRPAPGERERTDRSANHWIGRCC